jgi:ATP/maltotriose-dependent transcriptional regulator MalT
MSRTGITSDLASAPFPDLTPELPPHYVQRPRLVSPLERLELSDRGILAVWGTAGSGKSTLLASWASQLAEAGDSVEWLSLESVAQLVSELAGVDESRAVILAPGRHRFVFVDDVHLLPSHLVSSDVLRWANRIPADVRIVVAGRYDPFRAFASLRAAGQLSDVHGDELAFSRDEAERLLARLNLQLSEPSVEALLRRTGGWATGLILAAQWLAGRDDVEAAVEHFDGDNRAVADYLVSEIIAGLDESERHIVMAASVSETVDAGLTVELAGRDDAGEILDRVAGRNEFLSRVEGTPDYRFHPILHSFLRAEAHRRDAPGTIARHIRSARWYAAHGAGADAVDQSLMSGDPEVAGEMFDRFGIELLFRGHSRLVQRVIAAQPEGDRRLAPLVAQLVLLAPEFSDAIAVRHLFRDAVERAADASPDSSRWRALLAVLDVLRRRSSDATSADLDDDELVAARLRDLDVDLYFSIVEGWMLANEHRWDEAEYQFRMVAESSSDADLSWLMLLALEAAAAVSTEAGRWPESQELRRRLGALAGSLSAPTDTVTARALLTRAELRYEHGQALPPGVVERVGAAGSVDTLPSVRVHARVLVLLDRLDSASNPRADFEELRRLVQQEGRSAPEAVALASVRLLDLSLRLEGKVEAKALGEVVTAAVGADSLESMVMRTMLAPPLRARDQLETALEDALSGQVPAHHPETIVSAWILLAHVADVTGRPTLVDARVSTAIRRAEELGCERAFFACGGQGLHLLKSRLGRLGSLDETARRIAAIGDALLPSGVGSDVPILLTLREHELLRELPHHQTVVEIAAKQSLSPNTVKTHLRNIYQKLGASGRAEAIEIAAARGMI